MKVCKKCNIEKPYCDFGKNAALKDGHQSKCLDCMRIYQRNPERIEYQKSINQREDRKEQRRLYKQQRRKDEQYRKEECVKNSERNKKYYTDETTRESYLEKKRIKKKLDRQDPIKGPIIRAAQREKAKDPIKVMKKNQNLKLRYDNDVLYKLRRLTRGRLSKIVTRRTKRIDEIIGCDWSQLKTHLESQFKTGMSWDNWSQSGWHIDHIIPLASAKSEDELYKLSHYSNLQPLWWYENIAKSDKIS
jgi:hypothetical protein